MKPLLCLLLVLTVCLGLSQGGCASRQKKSSSRTYVGESPTITYGERESAGGVLVAH